MSELIALIIFFIGLIGMGVIVFRKIPVLVELSPQLVKEQGVWKRVRSKIKNRKALESFSTESLLHKTLSGFRVLILKTDSKTSEWLGKLRQRSLKKKKEFADDYWEKVKKKK